ncbi:MAG: glycosyltransferase family 2 protein [Deltaproteobacteria bacterium]|nr:glycosyltransferase family 2 protein [Deltaproteobacteria bacterium]
MQVALIVPAKDEAGAIGGVVSGFKGVVVEGRPALDVIVVSDNGSKDGTAEIARAAGALVVSEPTPGYGRACLSAMAELRKIGPPSIVVFADGDGSNDPRDLPLLLAPILSGECDLVVGARPRLADPQSLTVPQRFGNVFACKLMRLVHGGHFTDLGPFRAIRWSALERLEMQDPTYGWTVEMQLKALKHHVPSREVDVRNHVRVAGRSKVSGTMRGVIGAGTKIVGTVLRYR